MSPSQVLSETVRGQAADQSPPPDRLTPESTLVVGLGNPILGDDGFGWKVASQVRQRLQESSRQDVAVECMSLGGLSLMEQLIGFDRVILIDAISSEASAVGEIYCTRLEEFDDPSCGHTSSSHDTTLQNAIQVGHSLNVHLPDEIIVVGVTTKRTYDFSEKLSSPVAAAVPQAVELVIDLLTESGSTHPKE
jgi:hydrogenase maturation protease